MTIPISQLWFLNRANIKNENPYFATVVNEPG